METITTTVENEKFTAVATAECIIEDHGIGPYEYHGAKGVDVQLAYTVEELSLGEFMDQDGKELDRIPIEDLKELEYIAIERIEDMEVEREQL